MNSKVARHPLSLLWMVALLSAAIARTASAVTPPELERLFRSPPAESLPWTFWYWMQGRVSPEGITADLEAMRTAGLGGAYLMPIKQSDSPPAYRPPADTLTPRFWEMVRHAAREAERLEMQLGVHACDGFAVAGGPWITPELSMQRLVWSSVNATGGKHLELSVPEPSATEGYYRDVALLAFPSLRGHPQGSEQLSPIVTTSDGEPNAARLASASNQERYRSAERCWIQFEFAEPYTCRAVTLTPDGNNYQTQRITVKASDDGEHFEVLRRLTAPRHGWQDEGAPVTHGLPETTARYYRFVWSPDGSEPGSEELDSAKWSPILKLNSIVLRSQSTIPSFRGKSGVSWRISDWADAEDLPSRECVPLDQIIDLTDRLQEDGELTWDAPPGEWTLLRIGHTPTGKRNATGGAGMGLECDKLNPDAVKLQFDRWFGEFWRQVADEIGSEGAGRVLTTFHVDSWECGSQNWTENFAAEFERRRGYDLQRYLPCFAGVPVESAETSERFLRDVRATIAELTADSFYGTLRKLTRERGLMFTAECTAPTMLGDGMRHFAEVDVPMGEFWLDSPTHDKPNDIRDAVSAAHIYGKPIVQAEAFTQLRIKWDETPRQLKALGDRNLAVGVNRMSMHVFTHNPWLDRKPGQTLGGIGLYFQRDQPWLSGARGWMDYFARCSAVLQQGRPVADIAVWTGDDLPSRALTPEKLIRDLPGLVGERAVARERQRLTNEGQPLRERPIGVRASANLADPADWINPLGGYQYDSINSDALTRFASVDGGRVNLPGGASYGVLVMPSPNPVMPQAQRITPEVAETLARFSKEGATILRCAPWSGAPGLSHPGADARVAAAEQTVASHSTRETAGPWEEATLDRLNVPPDLVVEQVSPDGFPLAWTHRTGEGWDVYFVSNQSDRSIESSLSVRAKRRRAELWDPVSGDIIPLRVEQTQDGRTGIKLSFEPSQSLLVVLRDDETLTTEASQKALHRGSLPGPWHLRFEAAVGSDPPARQIDTLVDLSQSDESELRHFAGTTVYENTFDWAGGDGKRVWLTFGRVAALAEVALNGHDCGVMWTAPWKLEITEALRPGRNELSIRVPSTWKNRLVAETRRPEKARQTWTSAPIRLQDNQLTSFGLLGPAYLISE